MLTSLSWPPTDFYQGKRWSSKDPRMFVVYSSQVDLLRPGLGGTQWLVTDELVEFEK